MERVVVVGGPGSGKTTLAQQVAGRLGLAHVELDSLWWDPGWLEAGADELWNRLAPHLAGRRWVVDGNYVAEIAHRLWPLADRIVWLDPPRAVAVARTLRRSTGRAVRRQVLWSGNRETLGVLSPASVYRLVRRWPEYPAAIDDAIRALNLPEGNVTRLTTRAEVDQFARNPC